MKKSVPFLIIIFSITTFLFTSCNFDNEPIPDNNNLILPGKDRTHWTTGFDTSEELDDFIIKLRNTGKNGDFNFGMSSFQVPSTYKPNELGFTGYIKVDASNKEDIFNSVYDIFWVGNIFYKDANVLPAYNRFSINFYPFHLSGNDFEKDKVKYELTDYPDGAYNVTFKYDDRMIILVKLSEQCAPNIDKEEMITQIISNYRLIV